jgi:hypothetical protein
MLKGRSNDTLVEWEGNRSAVRLIAEGLLNSLLLPGEHIPRLSTKQMEKMCDSGLVEMCPGKFLFPESIDVNLEQPCPTHQYLNILVNDGSIRARQRDEAQCDSTRCVSKTWTGATHLYHQKATSPWTY